MLLSDKYPFLTNYFSNLFQTSDRVIPQSILFYGNDFDAQYTLAMEIARLLNCRHDKTDNCDCLNCRWIREQAHPAVLTISRIDNKPDDDVAKTVISIKQSQMIKDKLMSESEFHRVFIFCDRDENGCISGLNQLNFQAETANSLLKIIEEPQPGVTFIFLARYIEDLLATIISRSQCFFVPSLKPVDYSYACIDGIFTDYLNFERQNVFDISQRLCDMTKEIPLIDLLNGIQNYILYILKQYPYKTSLITHIKYVEAAKKQAKLGIRPINILDELCLKLID